MDQKPVTLGKPLDGSGRRIGGNSILRVEPGPTFSPVQPTAPTTPAQIPVTGPAPARAFSVNVADRLVDLLLNSPDNIRDAQARFDEADRAYKARLANLSLEAVSLPLFVAKDGSKRTASNDTERELAVEQAVANDALLIRLAQTREATLRELMHARNTLESAKTLAQLLIADKS